MKILFSPSESKFSGGIKAQINENSFIFPSLYKYRKEVSQKYHDYIKSCDNENLAKFFGTKKEALIEKYKKSYQNNLLLKAILRYDGVAYDYLDYKNLSQNAQNYIDESVLIFSNLYGIVLAKDLISEYKLKQGEKIANFELEKFYHDNFKQTLDEYFKDEEILDLRAKYYEKFYTINKKYTTMKFIKNGKALSHWAKAYRGIVLNLMAKNNVFSIKDLMNLEIKNLNIVEIREQKLKTELIYEIKN